MSMYSRYLIDKTFNHSLPTLHPSGCLPFGSLNKRIYGSLTLAQIFVLRMKLHIPANRYTPSALEAQSEKYFMLGNFKVIKEV